MEVCFYRRNSQWVNFGSDDVLAMDIRETIIWKNDD